MALAFSSRKRDSEVDARESRTTYAIPPPPPSHPVSEIRVSRSPVPEFFVEYGLVAAWAEPETYGIPRENPLPADIDDLLNWDADTRPTLPPPSRAGRLNSAEPAGPPRPFNK